MSDKFFIKPVPKPSICIIAHNAYGCITGGKSGHIGGVEWQTSLTAKWLVAKGYHVSLLTWDEGGGKEEVIENIKVIKMCKKNAGLPGLRFFFPKWHSLNKALKKANADIYYQNGAECVTGQAALWCKIHGRKFIFVAACDTDCEKNMQRDFSFKDRILYKFGLENADKVIVQTQSQKSLLSKGFNRDSIVIPMPCNGLSDTQFIGRTHFPSRRILWIARVCPQKRPDRLLDLAERCPDLEFDIVGPVYGGAYAQKVVERGKSIRNVIFHGGVTKDRVRDFYKNSACICSTSDIEGFPNTFLEAWSYGVPIVSIFDPDNVISVKGLGITGRTIDELQDGIYKLLNDRDLYKTASLNSRNYYSDYHSIDKVMPQFENVFLSFA